MSSSSVPTPFKIICVFGVVVAALFVLINKYAKPELQDSVVEQVAAVAPGIAPAAGETVQRQELTQVVVDPQTVIPEQHRPPLANGRYQNYAGAPIAGAQVELWHNSQVGMGIANALPLAFAPEYTTVSNADGEFTIPFAQLSPRHPQLALMANGSEYILLFRHSDYADLRELSLPKFDEPIIVSARQSQNLLQAKVLSADGKPASKAAVLIDGRLQTWTSVLGDFSVELTTGEHQLELLHDNGALRATLAIERNTQQQFVIQQGESITGVVSDIDGVPFAGVQIEAIREELSKSMGRSKANATTDEQGRFELRGLASGRFHIRGLNPQREYWSQSVMAGARDVHLRIDDKLFSLKIADAPAYAVWNNLTIVAEHDGQRRVLHSALGVNKIKDSYEYFLDDDVQATRLIISLQAAGYQRVQAEFDVGARQLRQHQTLSLIAEPQSAALRLSFKMPANIRPFNLKYALRLVSSGDKLSSARQQVFVSDEYRREYYYPYLLAGEYAVELQVEQNSFFDLPEILIGGSSIIKIEPNENNFIELDLITR